MSQRKRFSPPQRILMGPGPSNLHERVGSALSKPCIGHLDPEFIRMMDQLQEELREIFMTQNQFTLPVSGPGSVGMELCFVNLVEEGDKVLVCRNGVFGSRMLENVERAGGSPVLLDFPQGKPIDPDTVRRSLQENPDVKIVSFVHAETSTGVLSPAEEISKVAKEFGCLVLADTVTSLAGVPVLTDAWSFDAVYSGSQKCLSCPPGLSPVSLSELALQKIRKRSAKVRSWFMDVTLLEGYWSFGDNKRTYHHTAPINMLYALEEACSLVLEEILSRWGVKIRRGYAVEAAKLEYKKLRS